MNISDKTYLTVPESNKKYKLLSSINMPINSEAENKMMLFDYPDQRHQFVLEFEKIPEPSETEYSCICNFKYNKKLQGLSFTLKIDGEPYTIDF